MLISMIKKIALIVNVLSFMGLISHGPGSSKNNHWIQYKISLYIKLTVME